MLEEVFHLFISAKKATQMPLAVANVSSEGKWLHYDQPKKSQKGFGHVVNAPDMMGKNSFCIS